MQVDKPFICFLVLIWALTLNSSFILAQETFQDKAIIQFSGKVFTADSVSGVPGVHIYAAESGRGTTTNLNGFFTMPTLAGGIIKVTAVGFKSKSFFIPPLSTDNFTVGIFLELDTALLPDLEVLSYPTEQELKNAILSYSPPPQEDIYDSYWMSTVMNDMPMGVSGNFRYRQTLQQQRWSDQFSTRTTNFLNPIAWSKFIKKLRSR